MTKLGTLPFCTDRADGLPPLGCGESYFHASFVVAGEDGFIEGVVAASTGAEAVSLLLAREAQARLTSYASLHEKAQDGLIRRLTVAEAISLLPKVRHGVSMWKASGDRPAGVSSQPELELIA